MCKYSFEKVMGVYEDNEDIFEKLVKAVRNGAVPFVGAGLSVPQFPLWKELLEKKSKKFFIHGEMKTLLDTGQMEEAGSLLYEAMKEGDFRDFFESVFLKEVESFTDNQSWLPSIFKNSVVTTNYDRLLERVYSESGIELERVVPRHDSDREALDKSIQQSENYIIKIHGDTKSYKSCILTKEQYEETYGANEEFKQMIKRIFQNKSLVFLGCSLESDRTIKLLEEIIGEPFNSSMHFAIMPLPKSFENNENLLRSLVACYDEAALDEESTRCLKEFLKRKRELSSKGIRVIWYPTDEHDCISVLFEELYRRINGNPSPPKDFEKKMADYGVKCITFERINDRRSMGADEIHVKISQYYRITDNWDTMFTAISNGAAILEDELIQKAQAVIEQGKPLVISGNGGQGKSSLMMKLAVDAAENGINGQDVRVLWLNMKHHSLNNSAGLWQEIEKANQKVILCIDGPYSDTELFSSLKAEFPAHLKDKVLLVVTERIQRLQMMFDDNEYFSEWMDYVEVLSCIQKDEEHFHFL